MKLPFSVLLFSLFTIGGFAQSGILNDPKSLNQIFEMLMNGNADSTSSLSSSKTTTTFTVPMSVGAHQLWPGGTTGLNVTGTGLTAGMWEALEGVSRYRVNAGNSLLQGTIGSRISNLNGGSSSDSSNHATNVAKYLIGDAGPVIGADIVGIAYEANIVNYNIANRFSELNTEASTNGLLVSNHSYAGTAGWSISTNPNWYGVLEISSTEDHKFGRYGTAAEELYDVSYDSTSWQNNYLTIVKSAGNENGSPSSIPGTWNLWKHNGGAWTAVQGDPSNPPLKDGAIDGGYDCIISGAIGKNVVTVGSCSPLSAAYASTADVIISPESGWGPADDGRIKPDLVAPGIANKTSNSAPVVSGSVLLLQQAYFNAYGNYMKSATVRGLICHSAFEAGANPGPDYKHGWGMLNAENAGLIIKNDDGNIIESSLADDAEEKLFFYKSNAGAEARITLSWTDPEGVSHGLTYTNADLDNNKKVLVNDLDVRLKKICDGTEYLPFKLDPTNPSSTATQADNDVDNIEQIRYSSLPEGWYTVVVSHKGTLASSQDYSLIIEGFESPNRWTGSWSKGSAPVSGDVISIESNLPIGVPKLEAEHVLIANGITVTANTSEVLEISGNITSDGQAYIQGEGELNLIGNDATLCGQLEVSNLKFDKLSPNTLSIESGNSNLSITDLLTTQSGSGSIITNGNLTLLANDNVNQKGYAQVLDLGGAISGDVKAQAYIVNGGNDWRHLSSPVTTTLNDFLKDYDTYYLNTDASVYKWDNTISKWSYVSGITEPANSTAPFNLWFGTSGGTKYTDLPHLIELTGSLTTGPVANAGNLNYHVGDPADFVGGVSDGWNMIANPYPSGLDWDAIKIGLGANVSSFYYIYDPANDNYFSSDNGIIAPFQAFFVKLESGFVSGSTVLDFDNPYRTADPKAKLLKKQIPQITLIAQGGNSKFDKTTIRFNQASTEKFDLKFDAYKLNSPHKDVPRFYSSINKGQSSTKSCINTMNAPTDKTIIPLGFESSFVGHQTISIDSMHLDNQLDIWLLDKLTKSRTNLLNSSYQFVHNPANAADRFELFLGPDLSEDEIVSNDEPLIYFQGESLVISGFEASQRIDIAVYNMLGQTIFNETYVGVDSISIPLDSINATGAVIVSFEGGKTVIRKKLLLPS